MQIDTQKWSGEGAFTQRVIDQLAQLAEIEAIFVADAPASRSDADYNFISNEILVGFATVSRQERDPPLRIPARFPNRHGDGDDDARLEAALTAVPDIGPPDYSDDGMLQYLRTERIVPPYQTRGYKLVELVRIYAARQRQAAAALSPAYQRWLRRCSGASLSFDQRLQFLHHERQHVLFRELADRAAVAERRLGFRHAAAASAAGVADDLGIRLRWCRATARCSRRRSGRTSTARFRRA